MAKNLQELLPPTLALVKKAQQEILKVYNSNDIGLSLKNDKSPITIADLASHNILKPGLLQINNKPVVSEEDKQPFDSARKSPMYWLVDPLDGTKDFVRKIDEFTINVALMENHKPVFSVVCAPVTDEFFWAFHAEGAYKNDKKISNQRTQTSDLIALESRFHSNKYVHWFFSEFAIGEVIKCGSALKICRLAEGKADVYPRFGPTCEWDTAAAHLIAKESNCRLIDLFSGSELIYGKDQILNMPFLATRKNLTWDLQKIESKLREYEAEKK